MLGYVHGGQHGLVETFVTVLGLWLRWGLDESSLVDLVTRDLDVYVSSQDLELVELR